MSLFRINTNIPALTAQRNLGRADNLLSEAQERLSSGLRINSAADDAAGLAISQKNTTQIRGLNQASTNAQDGISMIQTAEGGLEETQDSLQRMRELAVQASNDTLTESDREQIQSEVDALAEEIQRISDQTQFNTKNLLNGSLEEGGEQGTQQLQVGANEGQTIEFNISDMGTSGTALDVAGDGTIDGDDINNVKVASGQDDTSLDKKANVQVKGDPGDQKLVLSQSQRLKTGGTKKDKGTVIAEQKKGSERAFKTTKTGNLTGGAKINFNTTVKEGTTAQLDLDAAEKRFSKAADTVKTAKAGDVDLINEGKLESGNFELSVATSSAKQQNTKLQLSQDGKVVADQKMNKLENGLTNDDGKKVASFDDSEIDVTTGGDLQDTEKVKNQFAFTQDVSTAVGGPDITDPAAAEDAISSLDDAINAVSSERSELGALQNRLETTISVNDITSENLEAARSRIRDADIAEETVKQTRAQILIEAGTSVLAQANQNPQSALQLLGA